MATVVTGLACSLSLQSSAYLQGLNAAAMATTTAANKMQGAFNRTSAAANATTAVVRRQATAIAASNRAMGSSFVATGRSVTAMANSLKGLFAIGLITSGVRSVLRYSDAWQEARNKIAAAESIAGVQGRSLSSLNKIATEVRAPIADIADLYAKLIRTASPLVKSEQDIANITRTVAEAFKAGGASTLEQVNGIRQLAQALGSGILQGDELRSIRENAPLIAQAIAHELNTTVAGLKKLGAEGKITSAVMTRALQNDAELIHSAFARTSATFVDSGTILNNALTEYIGELNKSTDASRALYAVTLDLVDNFNALADAILSPLGTLGQAAILYGNIKYAVNNVGFAFKDLIGVDTSGWFNTVVMYGNTVLNTVLHPIESSLKLINTAIKGYRESSSPSQLGGRTGMGAAIDYEIIAGKTGFGKGPAAGAGTSSDAQKAADKALKEHWSLINDVGSAQEKYQVQLEEIKAKNYSVADATRANANALLEYQNNLDKQAEALGLQLTPLQEYEAAIRQVAFAEQQWHISSEMAFTARAVAAAKFASTTLAAFGALSGALTQLFKENKAVAIANAIISTAEGIANSLKLLPSPLAWVYAAAAAVTGAAQIATILSTEPGSGSKTPTVKSAGSAASTSAATATAGEAASNKRGASQTVNITVQGESGFTAQQVRELIGHINEAVGDGVHLRVN